MSSQTFNFLVKNLIEQLCHLGSHCCSFLEDEDAVTDVAFPSFFYFGTGLHSFSFKTTNVLYNFLRIAHRVLVWVIVQHFEVRPDVVVIVLDVRVTATKMVHRVYAKIVALM